MAEALPVTNREIFWCHWCHKIQYWEKNSNINENVRIAYQFWQSMDLKKNPTTGMGTTGKTLRSAKHKNWEKYTEINKIILLGTNLQ